MATFNIEYLAKRELEPTKGSRNPVQGRQLEWTKRDKRPIFHFGFGPGSKAVVGAPYNIDHKPGEVFNQGSEDLWLFDIHTIFGGDDNSADPQIYFAIGPYLWTYSWTWQWNLDIETHEYTVKGLEIGKGDDKQWGNHWIAIRAPKMSNPAITISAEGGYTAVREVCQFLQQSYDNKHQYVSVKTTGYLTGKFAERHKDQRWWNEKPWLQGVDVDGRAITLFPKQMYGTSGQSNDLYKKFITTTCDDVDRKLSDAHLSQAEKYTSTRAGTPLKAWMWFRDYPTEIREKLWPMGPSGRMKYKPPIGYGQNGLNWSDLEQSTPTKADGFQFMLDLFGDVGSIVQNVMTGDFVGAVTGGIDKIRSTLNSANTNEVKVDANRQGFVTAVSGMKGVELEVNKKTIPELREIYKRARPSDGAYFYSTSEAK